MYVQSVKSIYLYFRFLEKSCQYCDFRAETGSNERYGNFTFYRGIHEFFNYSIFEKKRFFLNNFIL